MEIDDPLTKRVHIKMSGCPNGCSQHHIANIGFYGASLKVGGRQMPAYIPHLGGNYEGGEVIYGAPAEVAPARQARSRRRRALAAPLRGRAQRRRGVQRLRRARRHRPLRGRGQGADAARRVQPRDDEPVHRLEPLRALQGRARRGRVRGMRRQCDSTKPSRAAVEAPGMSGTVVPTPLPEAPAAPPLDLDVDLESLSAEDAIAWAMERFGNELRFAVSFQKTSSVMIDMAHRIDPKARFFYVDTGLLFPETYATRDALTERYGIEFERSPTAPSPGRWTGMGAARSHKVRADAQGARRSRAAGSRASAGLTPTLESTRPSSAGTSGSASGS